MLSTTQAHALVDQHLGHTPRAAHTRLVAHIMRRLAERFFADQDLWEVVGLCHDLDFFETADDRTQHGLLTVEWLGDQLPPPAQHAIAAHDHRTGVQADTLLADMLKLADAAAVIDERLGRSVWRSLDRTSTYSMLHNRLGDRSYLSGIVEGNAAKHALPFTDISDLFAEAPSQ